MGVVRGRFLYRGALIVALLLASSAGALAQTAKNQSKKSTPSTGIISKIEIVGQQRIEADAIAEKITSKAGAPLSSETVRGDILNIFSLGFFEDVQVDFQSGTLKYTVKERPVVTKITFEGSDEFETKDLEEMVSIKPFTVLNLSKIRSAELTIAKKYEEKGYYLARAEYELKRSTSASRPEIELVFKISENERVRVRRIFFSGNKNFTAGDLKRVMVTTEGHVFSWATSGGTYREDAFERDIAVLAFYYGNEGYIQAKFGKPRVTLSQDRRYIDIFMDVDEGDKFNLGNVTFAGDLLFPEQELRTSFAMASGDVFSTGKLQEEVLKLTDKYGDQGYAFANVVPKPQIREGTRTVDLAFDVEKGEKVYWGKISVTGNNKTHDKVVRRELPFFEGELYNATKRKKGLERVRRLGFFGNDVSFLTSTPSGSNNVLDLEVKVAEKQTGSLNVSAGFGTGASGFTLQGQVAQNNLFGRGQSLSLQLTYNTKGNKDFNLQFTDPKAFDTQWLMGGDLYYEEGYVGSNPRTYDRTLTGGSFRIGQDILEDLALFGTYKLARSQIKNPISEAIFTSPKDADSVISSVSATLSYDTRNNRLDPSSGQFMTASVEGAGLGGRVYQKYLATVRFYRRLIWRVVFRSNLELGLLANGMTDEPVPVSERFVLGYVFSLRGYPYASVGPGVSVQPTRADAASLPAFNYVTGGTKKLVMNYEIEFPLIPEADIRTVFFFDAGNAWDDLKSRNPSLYANYGWGIRWYSPLGPLRFEWGYPLSVLPTKGNKGSEFIFIIAPTF